jgi:hypothetical protein
MEQLQYQLKSIRLSAMAVALPVRLHEARANDLPHIDFLGLLVQQLIKNKSSNYIRLISFIRLKASCFWVLRESAKLTWP